MNPTTIILLLSACALIALVVNHWKKLPKAIFLFFAVALVISVCLFTFEDGKPEEKEEVVKESTAPVFFEVARDISIATGETRIALSMPVSGEREYDCVRFLLGTDDVALTEQALADKVKFSLLFSDGTLLPASGIVFAKEEGAEFPEKFVLKIFFASPVNFSSGEARCIVVNELSTIFKVSEVSIGVKLKNGVPQ